MSRTAPSVRSLLRIYSGRLYQRLVGRLVHHGGTKWLRHLPGTSRNWGPPRRAQSWAEYLQTEPGDWTEVFPAATRSAANCDPKGLPEQRHWWKNLPAAPPAVPAGIARIPGGRVLGTAGWPVGRTDTFLNDLANQGTSAACHLYTLRRLSPCRPLPGRTLNLASCWADRNFGHFFLDTLPRLGLIRAAGLKLEQFDQILVSTNNEAAKRWYDLCGLDPDRLITLTAESHWECESLYQPSPPGLLEHYPRWVVDYHRHEVGLPSQPRTRRLYVHRRHHRRNAVNEAEVSACLRAAGFEAFESTDPTSDRQAFAQASAVVGLHGAGLAMIACCLPGTSVLEIAPANHLLPHYRSLALEGGLDYGLLIGRPVSNQTSPPWAPPTDVDFHLPIPDLVGMLRIMGFTSTSE